MSLKLRQIQQVSSDLVLKDPDILDFLNLSDRYLEKDLEDAILSHKALSTSRWHNWEEIALLIPHDAPYSI
ncbi:MAG: DUF1016 domain-containing protein [Oculatellaceae cyanobacterium Prado106]|nr:DUF1016 domain-containing protein [Oculatellaceae cyanobacterium Prado106]